MKNAPTYIAAGLLVIAGAILAVWYGAGQHVIVTPTETPLLSPIVTPSSTPTPSPVVHAGWKTFADAAHGVSFQYPVTFATKYISMVDWPPKAQVTAEPFACTQAGSEIAQGGKTEQKIINGTTYCVTTSSEGAAGSIYNQYAYAFSQHSKTVILTFSLRFVQCANYDQPKQQECQIERDAFTPDTILDQIAQTVQVRS